MPQRKKCTKCGEVKAVTGFSKHRGRKDGLQSQCKDCFRGISRRYYEENREAERERHRHYREENREAVRERHRRYRDENREALRERQRRYYEENREAMCELLHRRREEDREVSCEVATRKGMPWTEAEDKFLLSTDMTYLEAAVELGRTVDSVHTRKRRLRNSLQTT